MSVLDHGKFIGWYPMSDLGQLKILPFGIYCFSSPISKPSLSDLPHDFEETIYFGMAGKNNDNFHYDQKSPGHIYKQGQLYMRLKSHKPNFVRENLDKKRDTKYEIFYKKFGYGREVVEKISIGIYQPISKLPNSLVRPWLAMMESYLIYQYALNFGSEPLMNLAHSQTVGQTLISEHSIAQTQKRYLQEHSLRRFIDGTL